MTPKTLFTLKLIVHSKRYSDKTQVFSISSNKTLSVILFTFHIIILVLLQGGTHPNVRHSVYSILRLLMGAARLMKLLLGVLTQVLGENWRLALLASRIPEEPKILRRGNHICELFNHLFNHYAII